eukprot:UN22568
MCETPNPNYDPTAGIPKARPGFAQEKPFWPCKCSAHNEEADRKCKVCGEREPSPKLITWFCNTCTARNNTEWDDVFICLTCGSLRIDEIMLKREMETVDAIAEEERERLRKIEREKERKRLAMEAEARRIKEEAEKQAKLREALE